MTTKEQPLTKLDRTTCGDSPTGAHHWVLGSPAALMRGECKYCHEQREFNPFADGSMGFNNSKRTGSPVSPSAPEGEE